MASKKEPRHLPQQQKSRVKISLLSPTKTVVIIVHEQVARRRHLSLMGSNFEKLKQTQQNWNPGQMNL